MAVPEKVFEAYGIKRDDCKVQRIGAGHIHQTFRVAGKKSFILQRVNKHVFKNPEIIASNLREASNFLHEHHPEFLFLATIRTKEGKEMIYDDDGFPWRLFPYIENTITVDEVTSSDEAFSAAREFARLTRNLEGADINKFKATIDRFHDLTWRWEQFQDALKAAKPERMKEAAGIITACKNFSWLVTKYDELTSRRILVPRIMHNDTKINNILFDAASGKALCAIDLDTLMPGYFIYDVGDMIRTFVSPVNEEEKDLFKIFFREPIYNALVDGYMSEMRAVLKEEEMEHITFGGMMMTYIMAMRMLTDFLNGDVYYHTTYHGQNLVRSTNQFYLLALMEKYFSEK
ncbi:MAG TPA: aminoglycoside phosphotransferase family protein [Cyclobacteriaceae bacterium]|nr:aminoglycoside phosphotransferase family protein [Cyclobacteriaceae bacterium]